MAKQLLHAQLSKYERHLFFVMGSRSEVLTQLWLWSWQDTDAERVISAEPAAVRYEGSDLSWLSAPQQLRAWSQPHAKATQMYSSAPLCSSALCPKWVDMGPAWQSFEKQYLSNRSTVTKRTVICVYWMTPERSLWEQWYVTDVLRRY